MSAGGKSTPQCRLIYEVTYLYQSKGLLRTETAVESGHAVYTMPGMEELNTKKPSQKKCRKYDLQTRPDLFDNIHAAAVLMNGLENACLSLDEFHGVKLK